MCRRLRCVKELLEYEFVLVRWLCSGRLVYGSSSAALDMSVQCELGLEVCGLLCVILCGILLSGGSGLRLCVDRLGVVVEWYNMGGCCCCCPWESWLEYAAA